MGKYDDVFKRLSSLPQKERLNAAYFEGLETPMQTYQRVDDVVRRIAAEEEDPGVVLFVSHSKVLEAVLACVFGKYYEGVHTSPCAFFEWDASATSNRLG